jgi:hypothetical protein
VRTPSSVFDRFEVTDGEWNQVRSDSRNLETKHPQVVDDLDGMGPSTRHDDMLLRHPHDQDDVGTIAGMVVGGEDPGGAVRLGEDEDRIVVPELPTGRKREVGQRHRGELGPRT